MTDRYSIRQYGDDYYAVSDDCGEWNVVNGIRTRIEAKILCDEMNQLENENRRLEKENKQLMQSYDITEKVNSSLSKCNEELEQIQMELADENRELKKEKSRLMEDVEYWRNKAELTVEEEQDVCDYLQACHDGNLEELRE